MSSFDSTKTELKTLLDEIVTGKLQLPDFQRGWVWDDEHIRSLLVSIARAFFQGSRAPVATRLGAFLGPKRLEGGPPAPIFLAVGWF